jgi:hypothetical protein
MKEQYKNSKGANLIFKAMCTKGKMKRAKICQSFPALTNFGKTAGKNRVLSNPPPP